MKSQFFAREKKDSRLKQATTDKNLKYSKTEKNPETVK